MSGHAAIAQGLCRALGSFGVTHVFGLPGTQNVALYEALRTSKLHSIVATSELSASMMANGYFRASGKPGVLFTIPGPGFAWALPGIAEAALDSTALVHIAGAPATAPGNRYQLQAFDQAAVAAPLYKAVFRIERAGEVDEVLARAFRFSSEGEPGPVLLHVAQTETSKSIDDNAPQVGDGAVGGATIEDAARALRGSRRCVLLLGQGCYDASHAAVRLAERLRAPVVTTTSGRGVVPEDHPLSFGFECAGHGADALNALIESCDRVLAIGCKFSHNGSRGFRLRIPPEKLIHVDASAEVLGANYPAQLSIRADGRAFIDAMLERLANDSANGDGFTAAELAHWRERCRSEKSSGVIEPRVHGAPAGNPEGFFAALREVLPRDAILVTDSGQHQDLARRYFRVLSARGLITPTNLQSMGFCIGAAIGAKLAQPGRTVVALIGDGGLAMSGLELLTAVRENLDLAVIVFADGAYGAIRNQQRAAYGHASGTQLSELDCAALAAAVGARYVPLEGDLPRTLRATLTQRGVKILEVRLGDSLPMRWSQAKGMAKRALRRSG